MPKFNDDQLEQHTLNTGHYGYSGAKMDDLMDTTEYTVVTIVLDESGSTGSFAKGLENCVSTIIKSCRLSPRADNLLLRVVCFGSKMREFHGFKLLSQCNPDDYDGCYTNGGSTLLFDSVENAVLSSKDYSDKLSKSDFSVNGIVFVLTDGDDTHSKSTINDVKKAFDSCVASESMESLVTVLVGVNVQTSYIANYLDKFSKGAGFSQYIELDNADEKTLAKLANFVSKSISSQSQSLGSGASAPAQSLTF